jgi:hypothetical protein
MAEIIETLLAEKGKRYEEDGQAIASYRRSIVFLPKGVQPGQKVRVRLIEIEGKKDARGHPMYRAEPAPVEYTERWKDNGDGTASRVKVAIDWLLKESEVEVIETRKLESREARAWLYTERSVVWGSSLTSSFVEEVEVRSVPIESEVVKNGALVWERTSEREERSQPVQRPVSRVEGVGGQWYQNRFNATYEPPWSLELKVHFQVEGEEKYITQNTTWGEIPSWLQAELETRYPVCSCGRQRRDVEVPDGYAKCELCRAEETCQRCGKQAKITVINGKLVCDTCQPYEEQEQLIALYLTDAHRQAIADEARKLLAGQALESELGFQVLKAGLGHITYSYTRDRILRRYEGYRWYYFTDEGVFGTEFEPAALQVLQYLPQATGNSLVELVAWVVGGLKPSGPDFYLQTQVEGKEGVKPQITEDLLKQVVAKLEAGQPVLADWLRGSESERLAALEAFRQAEELASAPYGSRIYELYGEARQALESEEQDYKTALEALQKAFAEKARQRILDDLIAREYSSCPVCGEKLYSQHRCERQEELRARGQYQEFTVKVSKIGEAELVKIVAEYDDRYNEYELRLVVDRSVEFSDPSKIKTVNLWREPSAREIKLMEEIEKVQAELVRLEDELSRCEGEHPSRMKVTFQQGVDPKGQPQLQAEKVFTGSVENRNAESGYSEYTNQKVLFVCRRNCPWLEEQPRAGQTWICSLAFQIGVDKRGWPVVVVNPQVCVDRKAELEEKLARLKQELEAEQNRVDPFDENGNPKTAMAQALRKAGLI